LTEEDRALLDFIARLATLDALAGARMDKSANDNGDACTAPPPVPRSDEDGRP
jgi:hypothetical protein